MSDIKWQGDLVSCRPPERENSARGTQQSILLSAEKNLLKQSSSYFPTLLCSTLLPIPPRLPSSQRQLVVSSVYVCVHVRVCVYEIAPG